MKFLLLSFCLIPVSIYSQCFTGLEETYCDNYLPDTLIPEHPGGYFDGDGVSGEGVYFPGFAGTGTFVITYSNTNYYIVDTTGIFDPVEGSGTEVTLIDDGFSDGIDIGFNFEFFGSTKNYVRIHSNGFISFNFDPAFFPPYAADIPSPGMPTDLIAASWGDYDPTVGGTIDYFTTGIEPNRKLVINYRDLPPYGGDIGNLTSQIILYETTNIIEIHTTASPDYGGNKSMGIENIDGTAGFVRPGRNNEHWTAYNDYVAFIPEFCSDTTTVLDGIEISIDEDTIDLCEGESGIVHTSGTAEFAWLPPYDDLFTETADHIYSVSASLDPGVYACVLSGTADNGCNDLDTMYLRISDCTNAIEDIQQTDAIIYPNPANEILHINESEQVGTVFIYDGCGRLVIFCEAIDNRISISSLPSGVYWTEFHVGNKRFSASFVVDR